MRRWVTSQSYRATVQVFVEARQTAGLTRRELAARIGRTHSVIANIARGERQVDIVEFIAIARALEIDELALMQKVVAAVGPKIDL
jgi:transcriptional regulator with XRE-family HTH domain